MWPISCLLFVVVALVDAQRRSFARFQRGDQGPDTGGPTNGQHVNLLPAPIGGPNVCRSQSENICCPGWTQRGLTGLCLVPICLSGCGTSGRCIKPNICLCSGGRVAPSCGNNVNNGGDRNASGGSVSVTESSCRSTCLNGGTCESGICLCRPGFAGEFCQEPVCRRECENGGRCIGPNRCACVYGYTGRYCEIDYRTGPCYRRVQDDQCTGQLEGVVCTRQLCCATIGEAWGHPCEECPDTLACRPGFLKNVHTGKCMDINECEAIPGLCAGGTCSNTLGSFKCECPEGMILNENQVCEDVNECDNELTSSSDICLNGMCVNQDPGYYCICNPGFIPSKDQKTCLDTTRGTCYLNMDYNGRCSNAFSFPLSRLDCCCGQVLGVGWSDSSQGSVSTYRGSNLFSDCRPCPREGTVEYKNLCKDAANIYESVEEVDECSIRNDLCRNGRCIDTKESYRCECYDGYELSSSNPGLCVDVDECALSYCRGGQCRNTPGGFDCVCPAGFHASEDGRTCIDYDECARSGVCANGVCVNIRGSFTCECKDGFEPSQSGFSCRDIDECAENPGICLRGRCRNTMGTYICECDEGFVHSSDGGFCMDENECAKGQEMCGGKGRCVNKEGGFKCLCDPGYQPSRDGKTCIDVDECESSPCLNGECTNTEGGFECECHQGFTLGPDGRTCTDAILGPCYTMVRAGQCINPVAIPMSRSACCCASTGVSMLGWGLPCSPCPLMGSVEFSQLCPHGNGFTNNGDDINECAQDNNVCENGACENLIGSFRCICNPGYEVDLSGKKCVDIDECKINALFCSGGQCRNTPGSYQCICPPGTKFNEMTRSCDDIDECKESDNSGEGICPNGRCINTKGSYKCECEPGSSLDSTGKFCIDNRKGSCWTKINQFDQCENDLDTLTSKSECCCSSFGVAWGSPCQKCDPKVDCECQTGYAKIDGKVCSDINECELHPGICKGGDCINTDGGFNCRCPPGLSLDFSGLECVDSRTEPCYLDYRLGICSEDIGGLYKKDQCCCSIGEGWGHSCSQCPRPGTKAFEELCTKGYGYVELSDINECLSFPALCENGRCKNSIGSYSCRCNQGYALDEHGVKCTNINECDIMFGVCGNGTCIDLPGSFTCECNEGFEVTPMMQVCMDIDECSRNPGLCRGGKCINTPGSYHCQCPLGHELSEDGKSCKDIDECSKTSGICSNGICENMMGAYQCICDEGYEQALSGTSCTDINECATDNGGCDDICMNSPGSYSCACSTGYMLLMDGRSCKDIDECDDDEGKLNPCNGGKCVNTQGSYSCICSGGLRMGTDGASCQDLDECSINENVCKNGKCENTLGSFECLCDDGFSIKEVLEEGCTDDDECALDLFHCDPNADCKNTNGSYECHCHSGYTGDGFTCQDINECLTDNGGCDKNARCINLPGSFKCVCDQGYSGDGLTCRDIDECVDDPTLCENGVCLNEQGTFSCDCQMGYMHPSQGNSQSCVDIDECSMFENVCINGVCENLNGVFRCICDPGYTLDSSGGNCTDVDECQDRLSCQYGTCVNSDGSYDCECPPGFELLPSGTGCVDKRQDKCFIVYNITREGYPICGNPLASDVTRPACCCSTGKAWGGNCEECPKPETEEFKRICPGGSGFMPNENTAVLEDINECAEIKDICRNGRCSNTFGSFMCTCLNGYELDSTMSQCIDIDECARNPGSCSGGQCVNTEGSFECTCPPDFMLSSDGRECIDMRKEKCYIEPNCTKPVSHRPQTKIVCCCSLGSSWGSASCDFCPEQDSLDYKELCGLGPPGMVVNPVSGMTEEIDECALMPGICQHGTCVNTPGSFTCECDRGYEYAPGSRQCIDTNECAISGGNQPCFGNSRCINTQGSFECVCPPGYKLDSTGRDCLDIDECSENYGICRNGLCKNIAGSFQCVCDEGYMLTTTKDSCVDRNECSLNPTICGNGTCVNTIGSFRCHCHYGFQISPKGDCEDIDECRIRYDVCRNGRCVNERGDFTCDCADGYVITNDGHNCQDIDECQDPRICPRPGQCQNLMGSFLCTCPDGYELNSNGRKCVDINECVRNKNLCKNGYCVNEEGSVSCECSEGWVLDETGKECIDIRQEPCYEDFRTRYCLNPRSMNMTRQECCCTLAEAWGQSCQRCPEKGSRAFKELCPLGSGRGRDGEDINECDIIPDLCDGGFCINIDGGFRCECPVGYVLDRSGKKCVDENECQNQPRICGNGTCTNIPGGFECECQAGYAPGPTGTCEDIDECREYGHQCAFRCYNVPGSFRCICPFGYALAPDGHHCIDINECETDANDCRYECKNLIGSFMCICPEGYRKVGFSDECEDINECDSDENICGEGRCINMIGGYQCECPSGYQVSPNGQECIDIRRAVCYKKIFAGQCINNPRVTMDGVTKADCCCTMGKAWGPDCDICPIRGTPEFDALCMESGFSGEGLDIDECRTLSNLCPNGQCVNTLGSYRCICERGYKPDPSGTQCLDVNECRIGSPSPCEHECINTVGSYQCVCPDGYQLNPDGRTCRDVDECASRALNSCEHECVNTMGSYECVCKPGFSSLGARCVDTDECVEQPGLCPPPGTCKNTRGSFKCVCPRGYRLDSSGTFCIDANECDDAESAGGSKCGEGGSCKNRLGSYECGCPVGFQLHLYHNQCEDMNECLQSDNPCGNARCQNSIGSYACTCPTGYQYNLELRICVQASLGCSQASCAFGCTPLGNSGFTCSCPRGYNNLGNDQCMAVNDPKNFVTDESDASYDSGYYEYFEEGVEAGDNVVSTEGCFACNLGASTNLKRKRIRINKNRRVSLHQRRRQRQKRSLNEHYFTKNNFLKQILWPSRHRQSPRSASSHHRIYHEDDLMDWTEIAVKRSQTLHHRRILFLQPAKTDVDVLYELRGQDSRLFGLAKSGQSGIWGIFFKRPPKADDDHDGNNLFRVQVFSGEKIILKAKIILLQS